MRHYGQRLGFAVLGCEFREIPFARLALRDEEDGRFGQGPA
jgi:hypothetical protein